MSNWSILPLAADLPAPPAAGIAPEMTGLPAMEAEAKVNILIVDDNANNVVALAAMLEPLGQNVVRAESGTAALRHLLTQDFALTLMDIQMPVLDGFQTAQIIRARQRSRFMPIIFLTAFSRDDAQVSHAYDLGAVDFLFKPLVPFILRAKVQAFVDLSRKMLEIKRQAAQLRDIQLREHEWRLGDAAQRWEADRLRKEIVEERQVAATLALTLEDRERAASALQVSNRRLSVLSEVGSRLLAAAEPKDFFEGVHVQLSAHLDLEVSLTYLVAADEGTLTLEALRDGEPRSSRPGPGPDEPVSQSVAASGQCVIFDHVQASREPSLAVVRRLGLAAYACFPLVAHGRLLGTLSFGTRHRPAFDADDVSLMQLVCDQVAIALERARLVAELSLRNHELARADRRKDEFLAMLAHELRNPMAPILNAVELLRSPTSSPAVVKRSLDALGRQTRHMVRLVDDMLNLSRMTSGKIELRRERVTLASIVDHAIETSAPLMARWEHRFDSALPEREITLHADGTRLGQVLANLLDNAAKYSPPRSKIELEVERQGDEILIRVRDDGIGIQPEMLEEVFGLFVQFDRTTERAQGGLGIGLTLVKSLVELHGGSVSAHSAGLGKGSEFLVRLPVDAEVALETSSSEGPLEPAPAPVRARARRVMVVEDNVDIRETMHDMVELCGHHIVTASDGPSGVEAVLSLRPDIAFVDIGLPGLDGYGVAAALRARAPDLATRLVALTGYGRPEDRARALAAGFDDHVVKPLTADELVRLIESS